MIAPPNRSDELLGTVIVGCEGSQPAEFGILLGRDLNCTSLGTLAVSHGFIPLCQLETTTSDCVGTWSSAGNETTLPIRTDTKRSEPFRHGVQFRVEQPLGNGWPQGRRVAVDAHSHHHRPIDGFPTRDFDALQPFQQHVIRATRGRESGRHSEDQSAWGVLVSLTVITHTSLSTRLRGGGSGFPSLRAKSSGSRTMRRAR